MKNKTQFKKATDKFYQTYNFDDVNTNPFIAIECVGYLKALKHQFPEFAGEIKPIYDLVLLRAHDLIIDTIITEE